MPGKFGLILMQAVESETDAKNCLSVKNTSWLVRYSAIMQPSYCRAIVRDSRWSRRTKFEESVASWRELGAATLRVLHKSRHSEDMPSSNCCHVLGRWRYLQWSLCRGSLTLSIALLQILQRPRNWTSRC